MKGREYWEYWEEIQKLEFSELDEYITDLYRDHKRKDINIIKFDKILSELGKTAPGEYFRNSIVALHESREYHQTKKLFKVLFESSSQTFIIYYPSCGPYFDSYRYGDVIGLKGYLINARENHKLRYGVDGSILVIGSDEFPVDMGHIGYNNGRIDYNDFSIFREERKGSEMNQPIFSFNVFNIKNEEFIRSLTSNFKISGLFNVCDANWMGGMGGDYNRDYPVINYLLLNPIFHQNLKFLVLERDTTYLQRYYGLDHFDRWMHYYQNFLRQEPTIKVSEEEWIGCLKHLGAFTCIDNNISYSNPNRPFALFDGVVEKAILSYSGYCKV